MCVCRHCGRPLTNPASVAVGAGPKCEPRPKRVKPVSRQFHFEWGDASALPARCEHVWCTVASKDDVACDTQQADPRQLHLPNIDTFANGASADINTSKDKLWRIEDSMLDEHSRFVRLAGREPTMFIASTEWFDRARAWAEGWPGFMVTNDYGVKTEFSFQHAPVVEVPSLPGCRIEAMWRP